MKLSKMKLSNTLLAIALPLALSAGCAMDVGSSSEDLTIDVNGDFGINECGQSTQRWLGESHWPVDTVVVGDMEFTRDELVDYVEANPGDRTALIAELAAAQLNMAVGIVLPDGVMEDLVAGDDMVMAPDEGGTPPPVNFDDFGDLVDYNSRADLDCFEGGLGIAQEVPRTVDTRDDIVKPVPVVIDPRPNLFVDE